METYEDIEDQQTNQRRFAIIEESINRSLLYDGEKQEPLCKK
jgi:hypothetical protein